MQCFLRVFGLHTPFLTRHLEKTTEHCPVDSQGVAGALIRFSPGYTCTVHPVTSAINIYGDRNISFHPP